MKPSTIIRGSKIAMLGVLWAAPLLILARAFSHGWIRVWGAVGIPSYVPPFFDLRAITSGLVIASWGGDPLVSNPFDPLHRAMNYPRIWLHLFSALGIDDRNVVVVGIVFCILYLICVSVLVVEAKSGLEAFIVLVAGLSLSSLFAIERGNTDLLVFSLIFLGLMSSSKHLRWGTFFLSALLKIYPAVTLMIEVIRRPIREKVIPAALGCLAIAIFVWQWRDLNLIRRATPAASLLSYGALSLRAEADYQFLRLGLASHQHLVDLGVVLGCWLAAGITAGVVWFRRPSDDDVVRATARSGEMFSIFGSIYAFSFIIGSNWDYRLIFLVPTLPFAIELARNPRHRFQGAAYILLVLVAENLLHAQSHYEAVWSHIATFALFIAVVAVLAEQCKFFLLPKPPHP
jgi:hypothetical protein